MSSDSRRGVLGGVIGAVFGFGFNIVFEFGDWFDDDLQILIMVSTIVGLLFAWFGPLLGRGVLSRMDTSDPCGGPACFALIIIVALFGSMILFELAEWWSQGNFLFSIAPDLGILNGITAGMTAIVLYQRIEDRW